MHTFPPGSCSPTLILAMGGVQLSRRFIVVFEFYFECFKKAWPLPWGRISTAGRVCDGRSLVRILRSQPELQQIFRRKHAAQ